VVTPADSSMLSVGTPRAYPTSDRTCVGAGVARSAARWDRHPPEPLLPRRRQRCLLEPCLVLAVPIREANGTWRRDAQANPWTPSRYRRVGETAQRRWARSLRSGRKKFSRPACPRRKPKRRGKARSQSSAIRSRPSGSAENSAPPAIKTIVEQLTTHQKRLSFPESQGPDIVSGPTGFPRCLQLSAAIPARPQ
jgi:hypothetical protein